MAVKKAPKKSSPPSPTPDDALALSLKGITLLECNSKINFGGRIPSDMQVGVSCESADPIPEGDHFVVPLRLTAKINWPNDPESEDSEESLGVLCRYQVVFAANRKPTKEELTPVSHAAAHVGWPYARAFVSFVTTQMGIPAVTLPVLRVDPVKGIQLQQLP